MNILIVEDSRIVGDLLARVVQISDWSYTLVTTGEDALTKLAAADQSFDIIVLNYGLSDYDGCEMLEEFARRNILTPVIITTGRATNDLHDRVMARGADVFLPKPFLLAEFITAIKGCVREINYMPTVSTPKSCTLLSNTCTSPKNTHPPREIELPAL